MQPIDLIIDGKVSKIYCEYIDRLSRVPAVTKMIEHLCGRFNVELVCVKKVMDEEERTELITELIDYMTVVCNRISAKKSADNKRRILPDEVVREAYQRKQEGEGLSTIARDFMRRKIKDQKGRVFDGYHFLHQTIRRHITANRPLLEKLYGPIRERVSMTKNVF